MPGNHSRLLAEALNLGITNARDLEHHQLRHAVSLYKIMGGIRRHAKVLNIVLPDTLATVASLEMALCEAVDERLADVTEGSVIKYGGEDYVVEKITRRLRPTFHHSRVTYVIRPKEGGRARVVPSATLLKGMMAS